MFTGSRVKVYIDASESHERAYLSPAVSVTKEERAFKNRSISTQFVFEVESRVKVGGHEFDTNVGVQVSGYGSENCTYFVLDGPGSYRPRHRHKDAHRF
jgi:hypothetical protein